MTLDELIQSELDKVPERCKKDYSLEVQHHEWAPAYGQGFEKSLFTHAHEVRNSFETYQFPYFICKHCHAVSSNYTDTPDEDIKRVR